MGIYLPRARKKTTRKPKTEYKIYKGVRCILTIIPKKIADLADLVPGDSISFFYDIANDEIVMSPNRKRAHPNR